MSSSKDLAPDLVLSNFTSKNQEEWRFDFGSTELIDLKEKLSDIAVQIGKKESLIQEITIILKKGVVGLHRLISEVVEENDRAIDDRNLQQLNKEYELTLDKITKGYEMREIMVYQLDYSDEGFIRYYDASGAFLSERRIAGRHQLSLHSVKSATDGQ